MVEYLGMEWLDHMVVLCLNFQEAVKLFSNVVVLWLFPLPMYESSSCFSSLLTLDMVSSLILIGMHYFLTYFLLEVL